MHQCFRNLDLLSAGGTSRRLAGTFPNPISWCEHCIRTRLDLRPATWKDSLNNKFLSIGWQGALLIGSRAKTTLKPICLLNNSCPVALSPFTVLNLQQFYSFICEIKTVIQILYQELLLQPSVQPLRTPFFQQLMAYISKNHLFVEVNHQLIHVF